MSAYNVEFLSAAEAKKLDALSPGWIECRPLAPDLYVHHHVIIDAGVLGYARVTLLSLSEMAPLTIAVPFTRWFPVEKAS